MGGEAESRLELSTFANCTVFCRIFQMQILPDDTGKCFIVSLLLRDAFKIQLHRIC